MNAPTLLRSLLPVILASALFSACAGYKLGNVPYKEMEGVRSIYVPTVKNETNEPGMQIQATNAILRALDNDGTYRSARTASADATLEVVITKFERRPMRSNRDNLTTTEQYRMDITAKATLVNHRTGQKVFSQITAVGQTDYFFQDDLQESERQAIPTALEKLATQLVNQITEGW
jgi:hypothetical protein